MARKRMIDPTFWADEEIGHWSFQARLFYIGLWNFADDKGRFRAAPDLLRSQIFPYDKDFDIQKVMKEVEKKVFWYNIEGNNYGWLVNFSKHQRIDRPTKSLFPPAPIEKRNRRGFAEDSPDNQGDVPANISKYNIREVKLSKEKEDLPSPHGEIFSHWNSKGIIVHRTLDQKTKSAINAKLENYSKEEINKAIDNFAVIALDKSGKYFWTHTSWTLDIFLKRGFERFKDESKPLINLLNSGYKQEAQKVEKKDNYAKKQEAEAEKRRQQNIQEKKDKELFNNLPMEKQEELLKKAREELSKTTKKQFMLEPLVNFKAIELMKKGE